MVVLLDRMIEECGLAGYGIQTGWVLGSMVSFGGLGSWWGLPLWFPCHGFQISSQVDGGGGDTCSGDDFAGCASLQIGLKARVSFCWACRSFVILGLGLGFIFYFCFCYLSIMMDDGVTTSSIV
jgi:hypothetical protein